MKKEWINAAKKCLEASLKPLPHELNELDWKLDITLKGDKLAKHLSAFANYENGGFLIFGIKDNAEIVGVSEGQAKTIISKIGSVARDGLEPKAKVDHHICNFEGKNLLFMYIYESSQKPVYLRGKGMEESYLRSAGSTKKMSRQEIGQCLINSRVPHYEELDADKPESLEEVLNKLEYEAFFNLLEVPIPSDKEKIAEELVKHKLIRRQDDSYAITNLGVLVAAKDMGVFEGHARRAIRVIFYNDKSRINAIKDITGKKGYAVGFNQMIEWIMSQIPTSEVIEDALRKKVSLYPKVALREILANALIHQDFSIEGTNPKVEIFLLDRMEITNPGGLPPKVSIDRIIGTNLARNELLARIMYKLRVCEDRGSGFPRALTAIELFGLPPLKFVDSKTSFKVIIYAPKKYQDMDASERIDACYQHCVLKYLAGDKMTNASLRRRLKISERNYSMVSKIIRQTIDARKIKIGNPEVKNPKYTYYTPYYA